MEAPTVVLAGNKRQYKEYLRENDLLESQAMFGNKRENVIGFSFSAIEVVGTFWKDVRNADEIYNNAVSRVR